MSAASLQCVADAFERWNRGDFAGAAELFCDDAAWQTQLDAFGGNEVGGREAIEAMMRRLTEELSMSVNFRRMVPLGDKVLVEVFASGRGDTDPVEEWFQLFSFSGEQIKRVDPYASYEEAAAAAE
jgi:ketosteroid isomerase-like protein